MIRFLLNFVPRTVLQRLAGVLMPFAAMFYAVGRGSRGSGRGVECPLCGARFRRFMPYGYVSTRHNALCPKCLALERHRLLWLWLTREADLPGGAEDWLKGTGEDRKADHQGNDGITADCRGVREPGQSSGSSPENDSKDFRFLHIAPESCFSKRLERIFGPERYITADLESPLAKVRMDVQNIPFPDASFDVVFCNHVLEHVQNDRLAMAEMFRVMRPGGWGVMLSPVDGDRAETFEDDAITDPAERTRIFGQYDHRRIYGRDYADRLRSAGWQVEEIDYFAALSPAEQALFGLRREILYVVRKQNLQK